MTKFEYETDREAAAILGAIEDLGLDFIHEDDNVIFVDVELQSEITYINDAIEARMGE